MYNDMYNTFDNVCLQYDYPISFNCRNKDYLRPNNCFRGSWSYGDSVELSFNLREFDSDDEDYFENSIVRIVFYNFRMEPVYEQSHDSYELAETDFRKLIIDIDCETSKDIFLKGTYFFSVQLINGNKIFTVSPPTDNIVDVI